MVVNVFSETAAVSLCLSNWVLWPESSVFWFPFVFPFFCLWNTIIMYHKSYFCVYKYITSIYQSLSSWWIPSKVGIFGAGGNLLTLLAVPWAQVFSFWFSWKVVFMGPRSNYLFSHSVETWMMWSLQLRISIPCFFDVAVDVEFIDWL